MDANVYEYIYFPGQMLFLKQCELCQLLTELIGMIRTIKCCAVSQIRLYYSVFKHVQTFDIDFPNLHILSRDPPIYEIKNFMSSEMCDEIIQLAQRDGEKIETSRTFLSQPSLDSSVSQDARLQESHNVRNSTTWYMDTKQLDVLCQKISKLTGHAESTFEEPQVVRYMNGQQYTWHLDSVPRSKVNPHAGNRLATVLVYLNNLEPHEDQHNNNSSTISTSGSTSFKELNLHVRPEKGKCLIFFPCFHDGSPDPRTLHCGQPVTGKNAEKWVAQIWVHQRSYLV